MYPGVHANNTPDKPALIMGGSGEVVTYRELDERSNQLARLWRDHGLRPGDHVAIFSENHPRYLEVMWAALRSGLYITTINSYLSAEEVAYILNDSGTLSLVTTAAKADVAAMALGDASKVTLPLLVDADDDTRFEPYVDAISTMPTGRLHEEPAGEMMLYSITCRVGIYRGLST